MSFLKLWSNPKPKEKTISYYFHPRTSVLSFTVYLIIIKLTDQCHMCGIFAYKGSNLNAADVISSGLKRLEYRGYDSWGVAVINNGSILLKKDIGKIGDINKLDLPASKLGIGHTRWATTGGVTQINAHPHYSSDHSFALVQNGIVENFEELKEDLKNKGYKFISQTDTEVIVRLIEEENKIYPSLVDAVKSAFLKLKGRNTISVLDSKTEQILAVRNGSPLIIGLSKNKDIFLSSDALSLSSFVDKIIVLDNGELVKIGSKIEIKNIKTGKIVHKDWEKLTFKDANIDKGKYDHYMIKEICDTPETINQVIVQDEKNIQNLAKAIKAARFIFTIGSGTAGNAAGQIAFYLREIAKIPAISLIGADAKEYYDLFSEKDLLIAPSQSGETADVVEVLEIAKVKGCKIATYVNMPGSMMNRMSDFKFLANAGPEICVMSTKIFVSQIAWGYLLAKTTAGLYEDGINNLLKLAADIKTYLEEDTSHQAAKKLAQNLIEIKDLFILGKSQNFYIAKEGMIKIVEGTYKHAHAIPAGDLKHYAITLIERGVYSLALVSNDSSFSEMFNVVNEIKSRGGSIIGIYPEKLSAFDYYLKSPSIGETSAIGNIIPLQLLAYYLAVLLGNNVDKPRNIAKSVTVK